MAQKSRRHWSIFFGIWSLAAIAPAVLFLPILGKVGILPAKVPFSVNRYRELLEADLMLYAIGGIFLVALLQTFPRKAQNAASVIIPQLAVWVALGLGLMYVEIFKPLPPPLITRLQDKQMQVPHSFRPLATSRYVVAEGRSFPIFKFSVCRGTVTPPVDKDCTESLVQVNEDQDIGHAFSALAPDTAYNAYLADNGFDIRDGPARIDNPRTLRVVKMPRGVADADAWVTLDEENGIVRFASCGWSDGCLVTVETRFGYISYRVDAGASQSRVARETHEAELSKLIASWQR